MCELEIQQNNLGPQIESLCRQDAVVDALSMVAPHVSPMNGGCLMIADALHQTVPDSGITILHARFRDLYGPAHALVKVGDRYYDAWGERTADEILAAYSADAVLVDIQQITPENTLGIWYDEEAVAELTDFFQENLRV